MDKQTKEVTVYTAKVDISSRRLSDELDAMDAAARLRERTEDDATE